MIYRKKPTHLEVKMKDYTTIHTLMLAYRKATNCEKYKILPYRVQT